MKNALKKILNLVASISHDKLLHLFFGLLIFDYTSPLIGRMFAIFVVVLVGIVKEFIDKKIGGCVDWKNTIATIIGGILGFLHTLI